jgi:hypothetical protein
VDPFGVTVAAAAQTPALLVVSAERVAEVRAQLSVLKNRRFAPPRLQ